MSETSVDVHPSAQIERGAELGVGVKVGPFSIIGSKVKIGDGSRVDSHAVIRGRTQIGSKNLVFPFTSIGTIPQDLKYRGEDSELIIGDENVIREYVNISIGTDDGGGITRIGSNNLFMVNTHIAHDCIVGNKCVFANGVSLGGHVEVGNNAVIGGHVACHQFTKIGEFAMLAGGAIVVQDVLPFSIVHGNHASPSGLNVVGLKRAGMKLETLTQIKKMYKTVYQSQLTLEDAMNVIKDTIEPSRYKDSFLTFIENSARGICR